MAFSCHGAAVKYYNTVKITEIRQEASIVSDYYI
jgi:hypothetical protein